MLISRNILKEFVLEEYVNVLFENKNINLIIDLFEHNQKLLYKFLLLEDLQGTIRNIKSTVQSTKNQNLIKLFDVLTTDENYKNFPNGDDDTFNRVIKLIDDQYKNIINNKNITSDKYTLRSNLFALRVILGFFVIQTHDQDRKQLMRDKVESYVPDNTQTTSQNTTTQPNQPTQQTTSPQQQSTQTPQQQTTKQQQQPQPQTNIDYKDAYNDFYNKLPLTLDNINNIFKKQVSTVLGPKKKQFSTVLSKISKEITDLSRSITDKEFANAYSIILSSKQNIQEANKPRKVKNPIFKGNDLYNILNQIFINRNFNEGIVGYLDSLVDKNGKALRLQQKQSDELKGLLRNAFGVGTVPTSTTTASTEPASQQPTQTQDVDTGTQGEPTADQEPQQTQQSAEPEAQQEELPTNLSGELPKLIKIIPYDPRGSDLWQKEKPAALYINIDDEESIKYIIANNTKYIFDSDGNIDINGQKYGSLAVSVDTIPDFIYQKYGHKIDDRLKYIANLENIYGDKPQDQEPATLTNTEDQPQTDNNSTETPTRQSSTDSNDEYNKSEKQKEYVEPFTQEGAKFYLQYIDLPDDELKNSIASHIPDAEIEIQRRANNKSYRIVWIKEKDKKEQALIYPPKLKVPRMLPGLTRMYNIEGKASTVQIEQLPVLLTRSKRDGEDSPLEDPYVELGKATSFNNPIKENIIDKITNEFKYLLNEHNKFINDIHTENKNNVIEDKKINARFKQLAGIK